MSHESGFRWGQERVPEDFGFRFAEPEGVPAGAAGAKLGEAPPDAAPPPAHPSGFRFAGTEPLVFRWGRRPGSHDFAWRSPEQRQGEPDGFRWKG